MELLIKPLIEIILPVLATVLTALGALVVQRMQQKFKVQLDVEQNKVVRDTIRKAIVGAEEWAARKMGHEGIDRVGGLEKADHVLSVVKKAYPKLDESEVMQIIDEEIATIKGLGSTMDAVGE